MPSLLKNDGYSEVSKKSDINLGDIVVYTDKDNNVEDSKMVAVKDKSGTRYMGKVD